jgi:regulator of protease activity HflC (stomatin/prohibitin superfamily)
MNKLIKILIGLILLVGTIFFVSQEQYLLSWGKAAITLIKGGITILLPLTGLVLIIIGITELKE